MKTNMKLKDLRIGNYFRELSVVIIGVAVTLFVSDLISTEKENNDLNLQLTAIYSELEDNLQRMDVLIDYYDKLGHLRKYLLESVDSTDSAVNDSIRKYEHLAYNTISFTYKKGAYDMFVNSGAMKLLKDREQLLNITESYSVLEEIKQEHDGYVSSKSHLFNEIYKMDKDKIFDKSILMSSEIPYIFNFHALNSGMEIQAKEVKEQIEKVFSHKNR